MKTFSITPPKKYSEEGKWLLAVTCFEATNSGFNITNEKKSFLHTVTSYTVTSKTVTSYTIIYQGCRHG